MSDKPKTVRVRIAVGVSADGVWAAYAWGSAAMGAESDDADTRVVLADMIGDHTLDAIRYVEADVPIPLVGGDTIQGEVTGGKT